MHLKARVQIEQAAYLFFARPFLVELHCDFFPHAALKLMRIRMQLVCQLFRNRDGNFHDKGSIASLYYSYSALRAPCSRAWGWGYGLPCEDPSRLVHFHP